MWNGSYDYYRFIDEMSLAIERGFTQAWYEGARAYGIEPSELTDVEHDRLMQEVNNEIGYVYNYGQDIMNNLRAFGGKLSPLLDRSDLWVSGYERIRILGSSYAAQDQKQEWVYGDTVHCRSCLKYNGRVYRASVWLKHNIQPKMYELECKGYHCECNLIPTNKPANKGYPPAP